jgi:hypothetical protein
LRRARGKIPFLDAPVTKEAIFLGGGHGHRRRGWLCQAESASQGSAGWGLAVRRSAGCARAGQTTA